MKKIKAKHMNKDRIICKPVDEQLWFWYQPAGKTEKYWLFATRYDGKTYWYFRNHGSSSDRYGNSLTLEQVYQFREFNHRRLYHNITFIIRQTEYVIREWICDETSAIA